MSRAAAATVVVAQAGAPATDHPGAKALFNFPLKPYQPREAISGPLAPPPQSIKDAIIRWLDEQL